MIIAVPVIVRYRDFDRNERNTKVMEAIRTMRDVQKVEPYALLYADMLVSVLAGDDMRDVISEAAE